MNMTSTATTTRWVSNLSSNYSLNCISTKVISTRSSQRSFTRRRTTLCTAAQSKPQYQGVYGPWSLEQSDINEVTVYRASLTIMAASFAIGATQSLAPSLLPLPPSSGTWAAIIGDIAMGIALTQIHIYVTPLKRFVQALWAVGTFGGTYLLLSHGGLGSTSVTGSAVDQTNVIVETLPAYVASHREAIWLIGCAFASLTGVSFKEGLCYGKPEAFVLTLLIPAWLLGHLSGLVPEAGEKGLAGIVATLLVVFAARKWTQRVEDDIGDKSVFEFRKLSEQEQQVRLAQLRAMERSGQFVDKD